MQSLPEIVIREVERHYNYREGSVIEKDRESGKVICRKVTAYILRDMGYSFFIISREIHKHHATVLHYFKDFQTIVETENSINLIKERILTKINQNDDNRKHSGNATTSRNSKYTRIRFNGFRVCNPCESPTVRLF